MKGSQISFILTLIFNYIVILFLCNLISLRESLWKNNRSRFLGNSMTTTMTIAGAILDKL